MRRTETGEFKMSAGRDLGDYNCRPLACSREVIGVRWLKCEASGGIDRGKLSLCR